MVIQMNVHLSELKPNHTYVAGGLMGEGTISRGDVSGVGLISRLGGGVGCLGGCHNKSTVYVQSTYIQHYNQHYQTLDKTTVYNLIEGD